MIEYEMYFGPPAPSTENGWPHVRYHVTLKTTRGTFDTSYGMGTGNFPVFNVSVASRTRLTCAEERCHNTLRKNRHAVIVDKSLAADYACKCAMQHKIKPEPREVMYALASDAAGALHGDFETWASEYDYDVDSRKAEKVYNACKETGLALIRLGFSLSDIESLACEEGN
jgi:hypothetical protein